MRTVFDIAGWFVSKEPMHHEKLQCLLYLSYAWFYALNQDELFETDGFEALPVLPAEMQIFSQYHSYGNKKIRFITSNKLHHEIISFLESVYDTYALADGQTLSAYLRESMPYQKARKTQHKIAREDMKSYYELQQQ